MYNTVGETAGVTQDVGSDPTVGDECPFFDWCGEVVWGRERRQQEEEEGEGEEGWCYCTFCGREMMGGDDREEGSYEMEMEMGMEDEEEEDVKTMGRDGMIDLAEMSRLEEDEDMEMDEEAEQGAL